MEQSADGRKFNRGKLLNIGFDLSQGDGFDTFVFHGDIYLLLELVSRLLVKCERLIYPNTMKSIERSLSLMLNQL